MWILSRLGYRRIRSSTSFARRWCEGAALSPPDRTPIHITDRKLWIWLVILPHRSIHCVPRACKREREKSPNVNIDARALVVIEPNVPKCNSKSAHGCKHGFRLESPGCCRLVAAASATEKGRWLVALRRVIAAFHGLSWGLVFFFRWGPYPDPKV